MEVKDRLRPLNSWRDNLLNFLPADIERAVVFINLKEQGQRVAALMEEILFRAKGRVTLVCFNSELPQYLCQLNAAPRLSEEYLQDTDYCSIDKYAINLTRAWYLTKGKDGKGITEYQNIQLGSLIEFDFQQFLICRIKNLEVIRRVIDLERPQKIVTIEETNELCAAAKIICAARNIPVLSLAKTAHRFKILPPKWRNWLSDILYSSLIDPFISALVFKKKISGLTLIDPRADELLTGPHQLHNFIFCPIEKGMTVRIKALKRKELYISFSIPVRRKFKNQIVRQKTEFFKKWNGLCKDISFKNLFKYKDISIWDLVEPTLLYFFRERIPRILKLIINVREFHRKKLIKTIVLRSDGREKERTIISIARELNIPTLYITHGVLSEVNGHDLLYCDKTAIWGEADFKKYVDLGNSPERLELTGSPKYDLLNFRKNRHAREVIYRALGLDSQREIVVFATQPVVKFSSYCTDDEHEVLLRHVLTTFKDIPDKHLVIKIHPFEDEAICRRVMKELRTEDVVFIKKIDIFDLIESCALLITKSSTVGLEAMILGRPVITINFAKAEDELPYAQWGAALGVYKPQDLKPAVERLFNDQKLMAEMALKRKEFLEHYLFKLDGRSSERVANLIKRMGNNAQLKYTG